MERFLAWLVIVFWGISFLATKVVVQSLNPFLAGFLRFLLAFLFLGLVSGRRPKLFNRDVFLAGFWGVFGYFAFENSALMFTEPTNAAIIVSSAPIFFLLFSHVVQKKRTTVGMYLGVSLSFLGVVLVILNGRFVLKLNPLGDLLAFGAALSWVFYTYHVERLKNLSFPENAGIMFWGMVLFLPFSAGKSHQLPDMNSLVIVSLLYLGLLCSGLAYFLWNRTIERLGSRRATNMIYYIPVVTAVVEHTVKMKLPSALLIGGVVLVVLGLSIFEKEVEHEAKSSTDRMRKNCPEEARSCSD
ncbi:DMT family transporter [Thermotoga sp.]|uniref:DMT family transporter n=1 Tax=Thermotoga sp. TaxID=28240 RepID=UPI0025CE370C|nr:DMT family transporter [Thermotoga sp.]MCD6550934.1 DMT family transporter [Thermotoga sp.]